MRKKLKKVLLVCSDVELSLAIRNRIQSNDILVELIATPDDCLQYLKATNGVHLIISQLNMNPTDGIGLYLRLRSEWENNSLSRDYHTRIVLMDRDYESLSRAKDYGIELAKIPETSEEWGEFMHVIHYCIEQSNLALTIYAINKRVDMIEERTALLPNLQKSVEHIETMMTKHDVWKTGILVQTETVTRTEENIAAQVDTWFSKAKNSPLLMFMFSLIMLLVITVSTMWLGKDSSNSTGQKKASDFSIHTTGTKVL